MSKINEDGASTATELINNALNEFSLTRLERLTPEERDMFIGVLISDLSDDFHTPRGAKRVKCVLDGLENTDPDTPDAPKKPRMRVNPHIRRLFQ